MNINDLSPMAYDTIRQSCNLLEALRNQLRVLTLKFASEDDFLKGADKYLERIHEKPEEYLDKLNHFDEVDVNEFKAGLKRIRSTIKRTLKTPMEKRGTPQSEE